MKRNRFNEFNLLPYEVELKLVDASLIQQHEQPLIEFAGGGSSGSNLPSSDFTFEFDPSVSKADKLDYQVAAASGALAALINELFVGEFSLQDSHNWGQEQVEKLIFKRAKKDGYKGNDLKDAIKTLEEKHEMAGDLLTPQFGGGRQHHLRDFSHHFSLTGLMFSLLSQFTNKGYGTDTSGAFVIYDLPSSDRIGKDFSEKLYLGTVKWLLHLLSDVAGHSGAIGKGTGIPGPILSFLKTTSSMPIFKKLQLKYHDEKIDFSVYLAKLYNGTHYVLNSNGEKIPFDLRTEMGIAQHIGKSAVPVLANEVIVRSFYTIRRIVEIIDDNNIESFDEFLKVDTKSYLPISNRRLNRMMTISSGTFVSLTTLSVTAKGMIKRGPSNALPYVVVNTNYIGVLRFAVAIKADFEYITKDVKEFKDFYLNRQYTVYDYIDLTLMRDLFTLDFEQARILDSIKYHMVRYDIIAEKDKNKKILKEEWFANWKSGYFKDKLETNQNYILKTSLELYKAYNKLATYGHNRWLTLMYFDLNSFYAYHPLDNDIKKYKDLKLNINFLIDVFIPQQNALTFTKIDAIDKEIRKTVNIIKGTNRKILIGTGSVLTLGALTGGVAFVLAPKIAIIIAGSSVAGLSGAALTSASLALVGGGSLAAGGLGMAGGTALIVGGGSLLGATLGTASILMTLGSKSSEYALLESTKLLTYIKTELIFLRESDTYLTTIYKTLLKQINALEIVMEDLDDKIEIKNVKESINYIENCSKEVLKIIKAKAKTEQIHLENN